MSSTRRPAIDEFLETISSGAAGSPEGAFRLSEMEVYELLRLIGFDTVEYRFLGRDVSVEERAVWAAEAAGFADGAGRLLLKVVGRNLLHKSDIGGVRVVKLDGGRDAEQLAEEAGTMLEKILGGPSGDDCEGVMACRFVPHVANRPGQEILLSLRHDPSFGPVVVVGIGGVLTEWYGRGSGGASRLILPATGLDRERVAALLEAHPVLNILCTESRAYDEAPVAVDTLADAVVALAQIGVECCAGSDSPWCIDEIEINPAVVSAGRIVAIDGVGLVSRDRWPGCDRTQERIGKLLGPRSAAVLGVSSKGQNPGRTILRNLKRSEGVDADRLWVIHPKETEIDGVRCLASIAELPRKIDLAVVAVPAGGARDAIAELVSADAAESIILIPGGFAEAGESGLAAEIEAALVAGHAREGGGPVMVGGNCLGIVSRDEYNTFFLPPYKLAFRPGRGRNLALVSQSGAYLVTFASNYDGIIFPRASISFGNQMDLTVGDFLEHFCDEDGVDVIACYVEGFRPGDGARILEIAAKARRRGKRIIMFKAGKTARGAQAAASHTASLAGDYDVAKACLEAVGVTMAETLDDFEDLLKTFTLLAGKGVAGRRVGIVSNAGFECSTVMDRIDDLDLAVFDEETQAVLDEALPSYAHRSNPVDATPIADTDAYARTTRAVLACETVDLAIISSVPVTAALNNLVADPKHHGEDLTSPQSQPSLMIPPLLESSKPAVVVIDSGRIYDPMAEMIERAGIPVFRKIDRAARALTAFCNC